jgi:hypothetical protein
VVDVSLLTRTLDVDFKNLNYRGGRLFIESGLPLFFRHPPPPTFAAEVVKVDINSISKTHHTQHYRYVKCLSPSKDT